jgi:hypothetical protein
MAIETAPSIVDDDEEKSSAKDKKKSRFGHVAVKNETPAEIKSDKKKSEKFQKPESDPEIESKDSPDKISKHEKEFVVAKVVEIAELDKTTDPIITEFRNQAKETGELEEAYQNILAELGLDEIEAGELLELETETELHDELTPDGYAELNGEEVLIDLGDETVPEENAEESLVPAGGGSATPPAPPHRPTSRGSGDRPAGSAGGTGFNVLGGHGAASGWNPNAGPAAAAPNAQPKGPEYQYPNAAGMALFGGIIGYLIGRRRGRIKTEKKLLPIQKKLEKQVTNIQFELQEKEKKIRRIAAEKVKRDGPVIIETFKQNTAHEKALKIAEERRKAPEAHLLHMPDHKPEHIGQMMVKAEAKPTHDKKTEKAPTTNLEIQRPITNKRVETISRTELLQISEKISVEGSTLRKIYETNLIGENGLRRLIAEHLRGGDLNKALKREIIEREIDFERDPALRDMAPTRYAGRPAGGTAALNQMLEKATATVGDNSEETAYFKARAAYESDHYRQSQKHQRFIDISFVSVILVLLALVALLVITRQ